MGRPIKSGLDYFPLDTYFFEDNKVRFISAKFGHKGEIILIKLLMDIYRDNGYFMLFDEDNALLFANSAGKTLSISLVNDVVRESVKRGLFDKAIFDKFNVLTSRGIQRRYIKACGDSKRINTKILPEFDLLRINSRNTPEETRLTPEETRLTHGESTQKKRKEKKEEESSLNSGCISNLKSTTNTNIFHPPTIEQFLLYANNNNIDTDFATKIYNYYNAQSWKTGGGGSGRQITNWQSKLSQLWLEEQRKQLDKQEARNAANRNSNIKGNQRYKSTEEDLRATYQALENTKCT